MSNRYKFTSNLWTATPPDYKQAKDFFGETKVSDLLFGSGEGYYYYVKNISETDIKKFEQFVVDSWGGEFTEMHGTPDVKLMNGEAYH